MGAADDEHWMHQALLEAKKAESAGEVPIGAVLVKEGQLIASGHNQVITHNDPSAHAEVMALRHAGQVLNNYRLVGATLYVTLEPCAMCVGAMVHARIERLVFGASDPKAGCVHSQVTLHESAWFNHRFSVTAGVLAQPCGALLTQFFQQRRRARKEQQEG